MISPPHCIVHTHDYTSRRAGSSLPIINYRGGGCMHGTNMIKIGSSRCVSALSSDQASVGATWICAGIVPSDWLPPSSHASSPARGPPTLYAILTSKGLCGAHLLSLVEWHTSRHCSRFRQTFAVTAPVGQPQIDRDPAIVWIVHYTALVSDGMSISACHH